MKSIKLHILATQDIRRQLLPPGRSTFWPGMKKDMAEYISRCMKCQQVKVEHQHLAGLLQPFPVPEWKWEVVSMDFITGLPMTWRQHDSIMAVVDKLTKETHFIPVKSTYKVDSIAKIFMNQVLEDMLRMYVMDKPTKWEDYLHLV